MINMIWIVAESEPRYSFWLNEDHIYALQQSEKNKEDGVWRLYANGTGIVYVINEANYNRLMAGEKME